MSRTLITEVATLCIEIEKPKSRYHVKEWIERAQVLFGASNYLLGVRGYMRLQKKPLEFHVTNWPAACQLEYDSMELAKRDPFLQRARNNFGSFRWEDIPSNERTEEILTFMGKHGMSHAVVSTFVLPDGYIGISVFASHKPFRQEDQADLLTAGTLLCGALTRVVIHNFMMDNPVPSQAAVNLTDTEKDCIELIAMGKTAKQVGREMGITDHTVRYHLDRVAAKLDVQTRKQAVAEAARRNLVRQRTHEAPKFKGVQ